MTQTPGLTGQAQRDLRLGIFSYEERRPGLGGEFLDCVEELLARIGERPLLYETVMLETKRALVKRFPYSVYYLVQDAGPLVIAILPQRSDPTIWQTRVRTR